MVRLCLFVDVSATRSVPVVLMTVTASDLIPGPYGNLVAWVGNVYRSLSLACVVWPRSVKPCGLWCGTTP